MRGCAPYSKNNNNPRTKHLLASERLLRIIMKVIAHHSSKATPKPHLNCDASVMHDGSILKLF